MTEELERAIEPFLRLAESPIVQTAWTNEDRFTKIRIGNSYASEDLPVEYLMDLRRAWINMKRKRA